MPSTPRGIVYPAASDHTRTWEHWQSLAETADAAITNAQPPPVPPPLFESHRSTASTSVGNGIWAAVGGWDGTPGPVFSSITAAGVATIAADGLYAITAAAGFVQGPISRRITTIYINDSEMARNEAPPANTGSATLSQVAYTARLTAGANIVVRVYQNTGGSLSLASSPAHMLQIVRLGA